MNFTLSHLRPNSVNSKFLDRRAVGSIEFNLDLLKVYPPLYNIICQIFALHFGHYLFYLYHLFNLSYLE